MRASREGGRPLEARLYRLYSYLGLPFDEAIVRFRRRATSGDAALDRARPWLHITAGLRAFPEPGRKARRHATRVRELLKGKQ